MVIEILERITYGSTSMVGLVALAAVAIAGTSALVALSPAVVCTGAVLGLIAPWSRR